MAMTKLPPSTEAGMASPHAPKSGLSTAAKVLIGITVAIFLFGGVLIAIAFSIGSTLQKANDAANGIGPTTASPVTQAALAPVKSTPPPTLSTAPLNIPNESSSDTPEIVVRETEGLLTMAYTTKDVVTAQDYLATYLCGASNNQQYPSLAAELTNGIRFPGTTFHINRIVSFSSTTHQVVANVSRTQGNNLLSPQTFSAELTYRWDPNDETWCTT